MTWERAARAAVKQWPDRDTATLMLAIGAAESREFTDLEGDELTYFVGKVSAGTLENYRVWSCGGCCSFGPWQVFLPVHHLKVALLGNHVNLSSEACVLASFLKDFDFCAAIAGQILSSQGLTAWSVYNAGLHVSKLTRAYLEIDAVLKQPVPAPTQEQILEGLDWAREFTLNQKGYPALSEEHYRALKYITNVWEDVHK